MSGVPQGSVLGPLLFLIFINSLIKTCNALHPKCRVGVFADDAKYFTTDQDVLQNTLNTVSEWVKTWQLELAPTKSMCIAFSKRNPSPSFCIDGVTIENCNTSVRDLGVFLSPDLKWGNHINTAMSKASNRCHLIINTFQTNNISVLMKAYVTYVRPLLEYNSCVWSPHFSQDIKACESIQKKFTKDAFHKCRISSHDYEHRLAKLNLQTLEYRRLELDLIMTYKVINNLISMNFHDFFEFSSSAERFNLRRHNLCLRMPSIPKTTALKNFFSYRVISPWNSLPHDMVNSSTLQSFKNKLKTFDLGTIQEFTNY